MNLIIIFVASLCLVCSDGKQYKPTWESLDTHKAPSWYDEAKFGVFMHWGLYSVPSFGVPTAGSEWLWQRWKRQRSPEAVKYMHDNYPPSFQYQDFAPLWKAEFFNASHWADLISNSGAKYYVITSKHHEGFTLWRSNVSWNWNAVDAGPHRDILGELADAFRSRTKVHFGVYFSLFEWFHPLYLYDSANNFTTNQYTEMVSKPQLYELVNKYRPEYIWSDGDAGPVEYWGSKEFLAWLYSESPVKDNILVNDRWGAGTSCHHGDVKNCADRYDPHGKLKFKWEDAMTMDKKSWGFRRNANIEDFYAIEDLVKLLIKTVSLGGNLLVNVGPTSDGRIIPIFEERLLEMGSWLKINGDAIYSTKQWRQSNDTEKLDVWYTKKSSKVYALFSKWPSSNMLSLRLPIANTHTQVRLLGSSQKLTFQFDKKKAGLTVNLSSVHEKPCEWAWTIELTNVK